jgi:hypothetical protein
MPQADIPDHDQRLKVLLKEHFWEQRIVRFEYAYVGLPALDGERFVTGDNLL